jgi:hypothetical protein
MVVGASIGANTAIMITEQIPEIKKVVMLSPGQEYVGLKPEPALMAFEGDVAIYASMEDRYSYSSSKMMAKKKKDRCIFEEFYGDEHGTNIINNYPEAMKMMVDWLFEKGEGVPNKN